MKQVQRILSAGITLTPYRAGYALCFWLIDPIASLFAASPRRLAAKALLYAAYFLLAGAVLTVEHWPRRDPAAEGLRRAYRLLPVDPGMALVRGRGALEHVLRQTAANLRLATPAADSPSGIYDLLDLLRDRMPADLYLQADQLRRMANEAAHNPDWQVEQSAARVALHAVNRIRRWSKPLTKAKAGKAQGKIWRA